MDETKLKQHYQNHFDSYEFGLNKRISTILIEQMNLRQIFLLIHKFFLFQHGIVKAENLMEDLY